jgi:16S rRNA (cytosine967-C5)-methyltransferase
MLRGRGEESWVTGGREGEKEGVVVIPGKGGRREDDPTVKNGLSLFLDRLAQDGIRDETPCPWSPVGVRLMHGRPPHGFWGLSAWKEGWFEVQDEGSQLVALATRVKRGEEVLDLCAGNGGKTLAMASWILRDGKKGGSEGRLWVYDTEQARLKQLLAGARRMGAERLVRAVEDEVALEALMGREEDGQGKGKCDVVLVDAPCSSTGVLRRRPSLRWNLKPDAALNALPAIQRQLLVQAQRYVKVGGRLVYATCSLLEEENEKVVGWFLEEFGSGAREGGREGGRYRPLPWAEEEEPLRAAVEAYGKRQERAKGMIKELAPGMLLLMPHVHGTDGFFIARFERYR